MCERDNLADWNHHGTDWSVNRRQFTAMAAMGALSACAGGSDANEQMDADADTGGDGNSAADAQAALAEDMVTIPSPDGAIDAFFVRPSSGRHPAILTWPDIAGLRDAFEVMARRLAGQGYAVLVVNPYYRAGKAPMFADFGEFRSSGGMDKVGPWREQLTPDAVMRDATAAIAWLDQQDAVDTARGVGTNGFCMGGPFTVYSAAAVPERVKAAASLHGAGLVKPDDPQSPHKLLSKTQARYLFAIAQNDDEKNPEAKTALRDAADAADRPAEVEVYAADHGWTVIDSPAYDQAEAERAWARMSALFEHL